MIPRTSGAILISLLFTLFLTTVIADDYLSDFESNAVSSNGRSYNTENSIKLSNSDSGALNNAVMSNSPEQGNYVEPPLNIPTIPPLPPPPGPSTSGNNVKNRNKKMT